jgi:hypothetical protein
MNLTRFFLAICLISPVLFAVSCSGSASTAKKEAQDTVVELWDKIPQKRDTVHTESVARYKEKVKNAFGDGAFTVNVYETENTFDYRVEMDYDGLKGKGKLHIPDFTVRPKIEIRKGETPTTCIIGFYDRRGVYREYKQVKCQGKQMAYTTLQRYAMHTYEWDSIPPR